MLFLVSLSTTARHVDVTPSGATVTGYGGELPGYGSANPQRSVSPVQPNGFSLVSQRVSTLCETARFRTKPLLSKYPQYFDRHLRLCSPSKGCYVSNTRPWIVFLEPPPLLAGITTLEPALVSRDSE